MIIQKITSKSLPDEVRIGSSKSYLNRALILASLKTNRVRIVGASESTDVEYLINCLRKIGLEIETASNQLEVLNSFPSCEKVSDKPIVLKVGDGGTTARFLISLLSLGKNKYRLILDEGLAKRPFSEGISVLRKLGASIDFQGSEITVQGPIIQTGDIEVSCENTPQFASSFILLNQVCSFNIKLTNVKASKKYLDISQKLLTESQESDFIVCKTDFSSISYIVAYAFFHQDVLITNVKEIDWSQADSRIFDIIKSIGGDFIIDPNGLRIFKSEAKRGFKVNGNNCLDLIPTLFYLAAFLPYESEIIGLEKLQLKESDRLSEGLKILDFFGVEYKYVSKDDKITFSAAVSRKKKDELLKTAYDHRMVMLGTLFFKHLGGGMIAPSESVKKSFPKFFEIF